MEPAFDSPERFAKNELVKSLGQTGDILFRCSDGRGPLGIPFMKWVAKYTQSHYTHAAILTIRDGLPWVLEITDTGTFLYRFIDWMTFVPGGDFSLYRMSQPLSALEKLTLNQAIDWWLAKDASYDTGFDDENKVYCTENVCAIYAAIGVTLQRPMTIKDIVKSYIDENVKGPKWYLHARLVLLVEMLKFGNYVCKKLSKGEYGIPLDTPLYFVGNERRGMLACKSLKKII